MTEEEFNALEEVFQKRIEVAVEEAFGRNPSIEEMQYKALRQDFINTFIFGDTGKHDWNCVSPGTFDSTYKCSKCGAVFTDQADAGIEVPARGCTG